MTAVPRQGWLSDGSATSLRTLETVFDAGTEAFRFDRRGVFWQAVAVAAERSAPERVVAIIDSGFDTRIRRLARVIHPASRVPTRPRRDLSHGTLVALLVNEVAPEARLLLVEARTGIQLWSDRVAEAIRYADGFGAHVINLSLEFGSDAELRLVPGVAVEPLVALHPDREAVLEQVRLWRGLVEPYAAGGCRRACELCTTIAALDPRTVVVAASGNAEQHACPACATRALGVGFHAEIAAVRDGRVVTGQTLPRTESNLVWEVTVPEPPGFEGTSFASPLISGLAALQEDPAEFAALAHLPRALTPVLIVANEVAHRETIDAAALSVWHAAMLEFAEAVPARHRHWAEDVPAPCSTCSFAMVEWYNAFTVLRLLQNDLVQALAMARLAATVAPHSPSAHGNLGETYRRWGLSLRNGSLERLAALRCAADAFARAARDAPDVAMYAEDAAALARMVEMARDRTSHRRPAERGVASASIPPGPCET